MTRMTAKLACTVAYWSPINPRHTDNPDPGLVEALAGPLELRPGRALDLGCGNGRNSVYLAGQGWDVTGIDLVGHAVRTARSKARRAGVSATFHKGDVTQLAKLGIGDDYRLIVDAGCFHGLPPDMRTDYVASLDRVAAPGALMMLIGVAKHPFLKGVSSEELQQRFAGWQLVDAAPVPVEEFRPVIKGPSCVVKAYENGRFESWRYWLKRETVAPPPAAASRAAPEASPGRD